MKPLRTAIILLPFMLLLLSKASGQYVSYGAAPWGQRWRQLQTEHFQIIYPEGIDSLAQRYAFLLDTAYATVSRSLNHRPISVPVILHPDNTRSNGMVVWAPRRMELLTTPPPTTYPVQWERQLAVHEFRHVVQTDKLNQRTMRVAYYLLGEQASGLWMLPIPTWFLEGDAVAAETAFSASGRGRLPEFHMPYRAYLMSGIDWEYDKWMQGSYKDYVPNVYQFGYEQVAYARYRWGSDVWGKVLDENAKNYLKFPSFTRALRKHTGVGPEKLKDLSFDFLKERWQEHDSLITNDMLVNYCTPEQKTYISYRMPMMVNDSTFVALKSGLPHAPLMVMVGCNGKEKRLFDYANINGRPVYRDSVIYWSEDVPDIRWEQRSHAVIKQYDLASASITRITPTTKSRYLSVDVTKNSKLLVASTATREGDNAVCIIDRLAKEEVLRFSSPDNSFVKEAVWTANDSKIACLLLNEKGLGIYLLDIISGTWTCLLQESSVNISGLSSYNNTLLFESGYSGINNIYSIDIATPEVYKLTDSRFGMFDPIVSPDGSTLYFSDYHEYGHRIAKKPFDSIDREKQTWKSPHQFLLAETMSKQENCNLDTLPIPQGKLYENKPYCKAANLFRFHSWMPFYMEVSAELKLDMEGLIDKIKPGLTVLSQNSLSTAFTRLGYSFENGYHVGHASFTYAGWFPIVDVTADYGNGRSLEFRDGKATLSNAYNHEVTARAYVPLNLNGTRRINGIVPGIQLQHNNNRFYMANKNRFIRENFLDITLQTYSLARMAVCDIYPRWGYNLWLGHRNSPFDTNNFGNLYAGTLTTYLPGLLVNHGVKLVAGFQNQNLEKYYLSTLIRFPRGYSKQPTKTLKTLSATYVFPIAYPDFSIAPFVYIKRFRSALFADYGNNTYYAAGIKKSKDMFTYGIDIIADYHFARLEFPFNTGVRILKPKDSGIGIELLFSISF